MGSQVGTQTRMKNILDLPTAAEFAGFSSRHFRKIIEEDRIPVRKIGNRLFIVRSDFDNWKSTRGEARLGAAIQQVDGWVAANLARFESFSELPDMDSDF